MTIATILLAAIIALVPILYPKYSLFVKEAQIGIESLKDWDKTDVTNNGNDRIEKQSYLRPSDTGFSQIEASLDEQIPYNRTVKQFVLVHSDSTHSKGGITIGKNPRSIEQALFLAEFENGDTKILLQNRFEIGDVLELDELEHIIRNEANDRSHHLTIFLVLVWTTLSIAFSP